MASIGRFTWDEAERRLLHEGTAVPLQPKVADTLAALLARRGAIIEKADLMKMVWPDTVVEEVNLERNISLLRKALGEDGSLIETIPKRGYRLRLEEAPAARRQRRRWPWIAAAVILLLVVIAWQFYLPSRFVQLKPGQPYLAVIPFEGDLDALDESVVAELVKRGGFSLLNPSVVRRYRWVYIAPSVMARIVGVQLLLEGRVERNRLIARVSDVRSGRVIWADNFPVDEIAAGAVAEAVGRACAPRPAH